ncbi:MAG: hypothetical protein LCI00_28910 [Chloroflexi bacterium]|nr:hypothetical protein [Chloroflexota bacterium]MCC6897106.1 hypothetical protein [Anaerolineae bacterium]
MTAALPAQPSTDRKPTPLWVRLLPYMGLFVLALVLWLPFGFRVTGVYEEWTLNDIAETETPAFFITPSWATLSLNSSRPLQMFFFAASYALDHNSHTFYNVFVMLFFFGKAVVVYWLVLQFLPEHKLLGFVAGILYMIYPADIGTFTLRTIHIHSAVLAYLLAVYLLIGYRLRQGRGRWWALAGAAVFLLASLWQYQVALPAALVTPLVMLYFGRPNRSFSWACGVWYGVLAFFAGYTLWANQNAIVETYEGTRYGSVALLSVENIRGMVEALFTAYGRQINGWVQAVAKWDYVPVYAPYLLAGLVVTAAVGIILVSRQREKAAQVAWWRYGLLFIVGLLLFPVGMAVYLPLPTYRLQEFRIYYLATLGSALALASGLYLISRVFKRYRELAFLILALPFVWLVVLRALEMHQRYVNFSLVQQSLLQQTVEQAPQIARDTVVVVVDESADQKIDNENVFAFMTIYPLALHYLYDDWNFDAQYCPAEGKSSRGTTCTFEPDGLNIREAQYYEGVYLRERDEILSYDRILLYRYTSDGQLALLSPAEAEAAFGISGYDPQARITGETPPFRTSTLFSCVPALSCYQDKPIVPRSSFDLPDAGEIGTGWRAPEPSGQGEVYRWSVNTTSTVTVDLSDSSDLTVAFKAVSALDPTLLDSLRLTVNGQDIPLAYTAPDAITRLYTATIPRDVLVGQSPRTALTFTVDRLIPVPDAPDVLLGWALYGLRVRGGS